MPEEVREPIIQMVGINKFFGGVQAVNSVDLTLYPGEVLAVLGDNGAGKSTLIKCLSGAFSADGGEIYFKGKKVDISNTVDARKLGIETIYQNLGLVDTYNFYENIFLGREILYKGFLGKLGFVNIGAMSAEGLRLIKSFGINIPNRRVKVNSLSGGQRQIVAISRAIYFNAEVIIMDEPTAALGVAETQKVYDFIRMLKNKGISIIIISHNINEVFNIADRYMVLKVGKLVGVKKREESSVDKIVEMIISGKDSKAVETNSQQ
jgi:D-xylose transport system ATP-binding protein